MIVSFECVKCHGHYTVNTKDYFLYQNKWEIFCPKLFCGQWTEIEREKFDHKQYMMKRNRAIKIANKHYRESKEIDDILE
jgi:hypothetical protein